MSCNTNNLFLQIKKESNNNINVGIALLQWDEREDG